MQTRDDFREFNIKKVSLTHFSLVPPCSSHSPPWLSSSYRTIAQIIRSRRMESIPAQINLTLVRTRPVVNIINRRWADKIIAMNFKRIIELIRMYPKRQIIPILCRGRLSFRNHRGKTQGSAISRCLKMPAFILDKARDKSTLED